jgi:hypothetical protein
MLEKEVLQNNASFGRRERQSGQRSIGKHVPKSVIGIRYQCVSKQASQTVRYDHHVARCDGTACRIE